MASQFPKPLFIDIEGGTHALDVARADPEVLGWLMQMLDGFSQRDLRQVSTGLDTADWTRRCSKRPFLPGRREWLHLATWLTARCTRSWANGEGDLLDVAGADCRKDARGSAGTAS